MTLYYIKFYIKVRIKKVSKKEARNFHILMKLLYIWYKVNSVFYNLKNIKAFLNKFYINQLKSIFNLLIKHRSCRFEL